MIVYIVIFLILLAAEMLYFRIADRCNIIDKPNERSSHSTIVLRGGGIIFMLGLWIWAAFFGFGSVGDRIQENRDNYTRICIACIIAIIIINLFTLILLS